MRFPRTASGRRSSRQSPANIEASKRSIAPGGGADAGSGRQGDNEGGRGETADPVGVVECRSDSVWNTGRGRDASASTGDNTEYGAAAVTSRGTRGGGPPGLYQRSFAVRQRSRDLPRPSHPSSGCARPTSRRSAAARGAGRLDASTALAERSRANR